MYASLGSEPAKLAPAKRVDLGPDGAVLLTSEDRMVIHRRSDPKRALHTWQIVASQTGFEQMKRLAGGRFITLCTGVDGAESVVGADLEQRRFTVAIDAVMRCAVDEKNMRLVVMRTEPTPTHARVLLELHPLDGKPPITVRFPKVKSFEDASLYLVRGTASVSVGQGKARKTFYFRLTDGKRVTKPPKTTDRGPLRFIPVGHADATTDVSPLASLTQPPRKLVEPYFAKLQVWSENGVRSFDRKTVAVFDQDPTGDMGVHLLIGDTKPLKLRHRIPLNMGENWLTAYFSNDRILVVQSYPSLTFIDALHGEVIGYGDMSDFYQLRSVGPELLGFGPDLWDLSPAAPSGNRAVSLPADPRIRLDSVDGGYRGDNRDDTGSILLRKDGTAELVRYDVPSWLHCRAGELVVPWAVCRGRATRATTTE